MSLFSVVYRCLFRDLVLVCCCVFAAVSSSFVIAEPVFVGRFDSSNSQPASPWQVVRFDEKIPATQFQIIDWHNRSALEAVAESSMALLARPVEVDIEKTPILCWQWWVDMPVDQADMNIKAGDDYAARLYLTFDLPDDQLSLGTRLKLSLARQIYGDQVPEAAINYVWDNKHPIGTQQNNAYTDRAKMVVQRTGSVDTGRWIDERRNVQTDVNTLFNSAGAKLIQIALASDTDNTKSAARALFANLHFVATEIPCHF